MKSYLSSDCKGYNFVAEQPDHVHLYAIYFYVDHKRMRRRRIGVPILHRLCLKFAWISRKKRFMYIFERD